MSETFTVTSLASDGLSSAASRVGGVDLVPPPAEGLTIRIGRKLPLALRRVVFRGDLRSMTGYGKETRAWADLLAQRCEIFGVDLHPNPQDCGGAFPGKLIQERDIMSLIAESEAPPVVISHTIPDMFTSFPGAINVGTFPWETDAIPYHLNWPEMIRSVDHIWAKTTFLEGIIRRCGYDGPLPMVPWPHEFDRPAISRSRSISGVSLAFFDTLNALEPESLSATHVRANFQNLFLTVQSLAPRKGLPILLSEWRDFVLDDRAKDVLILKLRFVHNTRLQGDPIRQFRLLLEEVGFKSGDPVRIALVSDELDEDQLQGLYALSDAYVTASYGEGFGGPVAESLVLGRPVISPRHTGAADLLPADYPLIVDHVTRVVGLRGNPSIYPHAADWRLPVRGSMRKAFVRFASMSQTDRDAALTSARSHAANFCSTRVVQARLNRILDDMLVESS